MSNTVRVPLRLDQLDLIVIIAERVFNLSAPDVKSKQTADIIGRRVLRKRCRELIEDVQRVYSEAGK